MSSSLIRKYMKILESKLDEVSPHNYDSDWDYQDAMAAAGRSRGSRDEPDDVQPDAVPDEADRWRERWKLVSVKSSEGVAPNNRRYNMIEICDAPDQSAIGDAVNVFKEIHRGAKFVSYLEVSETGDAKMPLRVTIYAIDYHAAGYFVPFKDVGKVDAPLYPDNIKL